MSFFPQLCDAILTTLHEPLLVLDSDLTVSHASPAFYRTFNVSVGQTIGHKIYDLGNRQWDIPALRRLLQDILPANGEMNDYLVEHDFPTLGRRIMRLNARRLHDHGSIDLILLAIADVTDSERAASEVARQRAWFQTTLSSIGDAVIATDPGARVTFMNPTAEDMTGWTAAEAQGRPLSEVFHIVNEETRGQVESPVNKSLRLGAIVGLANHTLLIAKDGTERPIDDSAAPIRVAAHDSNAPDGVEGVVMVFHDISERRRYELELETSEIRYRRLFEAAHDGILILDAVHKRITDVNPFLLSLLNFPRQYFIGKELWEIGVFKDKASSQRAFQALQDGGTLRYEDLPLQDGDGRQHPVELVANIYQEDHMPVIQCNIRDISVRKRYEREREALLANEQAARIEAVAANRAKDVFLSTLSHEVRTPLHAIMGWAALLSDKRRTDEELREGMEVIQRNCVAQAQIIEDIMDISRFISGTIQLDLQPCPLPEIIHEALDVVRPAANLKGISLELDLDESAKTDCDAKRIRQIVWNLLNNAVKFTPKGGHIKTTLAHDGSKLSIRVSDDGEGIPPAFLDHVFDRFSQADGSTGRRHGGLGLGLSIVKSLVELHGGTVQAESAGPGKGATFTVRLPVRAVQADSSPIRPHAVAGAEVLVRLDGLSVLTVDDEPDARRLVEKVITESGARVMMAASAAEAVSALLAMDRAGHMPDVLISDIAMPDEDGFELIRQVRGRGFTARRLPAIALTAFAKAGYSRTALLAGYQFHLAKPVDPRDLVAAIAAVAGRTGAPPAESASTA